MDGETLALSDVKEAVRRHWAARAETFDEKPNHGLHSDAQRTAWLARLAAWAGRAPRDTLDVGCGTGFLALLLAQLGHRAVGVDLAEEMLVLARGKAAQAHLAADFRRADAEHLPFAAASFDLVVARHVIWTLPDPAGAALEWARVLRPGGRLVLVEGHRWADSPDTGHPDYAPIRDALPLYGGRPAAELTPYLSAAGLAGVEVESLMAPRLWGGPVERERYALHARTPAC